MRDVQFPLSHVAALVGLCALLFGAGRAWGTSGVLLGFFASMVGTLALVGRLGLSAHTMGRSRADELTRWAKISWLVMMVAILLLVFRVWD